MLLHQENITGCDFLVAATSQIYFDFDTVVPSHCGVKQQMLLLKLYNN
jgi:hypothetical protein